MATATVVGILLALWAWFRRKDEEDIPLRPREPMGTEAEALAAVAGFGGVETSGVRESPGEDVGGPFRGAEVFERQNPFGPAPAESGQQDTQGTLGPATSFFDTAPLPAREPPPPEPPPGGEPLNPDLPSPSMTVTVDPPRILTPEGYNRELAEELAPLLAQSVRRRGFDYDRALCRRFQFFAGIPVDGIYGLCTARACSTFLTALGLAPAPRALFGPPRNPDTCPGYVPWDER